MISKIYCPRCSHDFTTTDLTPDDKPWPGLTKFICPACRVSFQGVPLKWEEIPVSGYPLSDSRSDSAHTPENAWAIAFGACGVFFVVGFIGMFSSLNNTEGSSGLTFALMMMGAFVFAIILWAMKMGTESGWEPPDAQTQRNNQRFIGFQQRKEMNEKLEDIRDSLDQD